MNVFLANVGERDIALRVEDAALVTLRGSMNEFDHIQQKDLPEDIRGVEGTRHLSAKVRENIVAHKANLHFPIIKPALRAVLDMVRTVDKIVLFATDQPKTLPGGHYDRDSIKSAKLLKETLIPCKFGIPEEKIKVVEVAGFNPSQHEPAYEFIGKKLEELKIAKKAQVFASIKGGIPGMNSALRERAVQHFGPRAWLVETDELSKDDRASGKEGTATVTSSWPFRKQSVLRLLEDFLNRHDYSAAWRLLTFHAVKSREAKAYIEHALARTNLDFDGAVECLNGCTLPADAEWENSATDKNEWCLQRLDDLAESARVAFERRDYAGFLYRVKTFHESCSAIWKKAATKSNPHANDLHTDLNGFLKLNKLRDGLAHKSKGASLSDLKSAFPDIGKKFRPLTKKILNKIKSILNDMGTSPQDIIPVYDQINKEVRNLVEKWNPRP